MPYTGKLEERPLLDVVQIVAYSQQSGILTVDRRDARGLILFERGGVVCAYSPSALSLLIKSAKEVDEKARLSLRRIQILTALRELFDWPSGDYRFVRKTEPVDELEGLEGLSVRTFYAGGALDTGDLLLVLEKAMEDSAAVEVDLEPEPVDSGTERPHEEQRRFPRFGPVIIRGAILDTEGRAIEGYLTNLSEGGTFLHANEFPALGGEVQLDFELPWNLGPCRTRARVVWVRVDGPEAKRGAGLSFTEFSGNGKIALSGYLARFQELASDVGFQA